MQPSCSTDCVGPVATTAHADAIYLEGLPDVPESRPHSEVNEWGFKE